MTETLIAAVVIATVALLMWQFIDGPMRRWEKWSRGRDDE